MCGQYLVRAPPPASGQVGFSRRYGHGCYNLVLEHESLDAFKDPEEDEEDADVLDPRKLDGFPEAWAIGGGKGSRQKTPSTTL